eukprot:85313_1
MTILVNLGVAFSVFIVSVVILSTNYKTIWPAPNFVTHSATYDYIFQDIASNSFINNPIEIEYTYKSQPIPTLSSNFIENNSFDSPHHKELILHQSILEKQSNLHHLLHIPPWALVPDRISHASGTVSDLFKIFDSLRLKQELTLSILSDIIEIIPTESIIKSHMEHLSSSEKFWISNITSELFNASQIIFSYQLINYADEISEWIQNSEYSNKYLRLLFERIRGLPLLYNPFIKEQYNNINLEYNNLCIEIINLIDESDDNDIMTIEQCIIFLDNIIPWIPDKPITLTTMWPEYYDIDFNLLKKIKGINSPYTMVVRQSRKPSGTLLHYVSSKGDERIQVEWFNKKYHLRATNLAFVRRIRIQIKRISKFLKNSVTLSSEEDEIDDFASFWASLEAEEEVGPKVSDRYIEQLDESFKQYIKNYGSELEKGQFDKILDMDLAQNENNNNNIFVHGLPSIPIFNDGNIKRSWNFIIGIIDYELIDYSHDLNINMKFMNYINIFDNIQSLYHKKEHNIEFEIIGIWPYAIGGYLRGITPEIFKYIYPPYNDAKKTYGKQRCVLLLDVMEKLYNNNMRQIAIQKLINNDHAQLITLKSLIKYIINIINIKHKYFNQKNYMNKLYSVKQALFIRLNALIQCNDDYGCVLSALFYNIIQAFNRNNQNSLLFIAFLQNEKIIKWEKKENSNKDVINVMNEGNDINKLNDEILWNEWKNKYFNSDVDQQIIENMKNEFINNNDLIKLYKKSIRHVAKYSVLRRPGEDTFVLE